MPCNRALCLFLVDYTLCNFSRVMNLSSLMAWADVPIILSCTLSSVISSCNCPDVYTGKTCSETNYCYGASCPADATCNSLADGYECKGSIQCFNLAFHGLNFMLWKRFKHLTSWGLLFRPGDLSGGPDLEAWNSSYFDLDCFEISCQIYRYFYLHLPQVND